MEACRAEYILALNISDLEMRRMYSVSELPASSRGQSTFTEPEQYMKASLWLCQSVADASGFLLASLSSIVTIIEVKAGLTMLMLPYNILHLSPFSLSVSSSHETVLPSTLRELWTKPGNPRYEDILSL